MLAEYTAGTAAASPERKYIYSVYIDEPIALVDRTAAGNVAAGTDEILYYHRNRQYSIIGLTNASTGTVVERYAYTAYGKPTITDGTGLNVRATSLYGNAYMHTGRRYDHESGLYYYRARYYAPVLGRFLERDPLGYPDGLNSYDAYHLLHGTLDPTGMDRIEAVWSDDNQRFALDYVNEAPWGTRWALGEDAPERVGYLRDDGFVELPNGRLATIESVVAEADSAGTDWDDFEDSHPLCLQ